MIQQPSRIPKGTSKNNIQLLKNYLLGTYYIVSKNRHGPSPHEGSNRYVSSIHTYQNVTNCGKSERKVHVNRRANINKGSRTCLGIHKCFSLSG